MRKQNAQMEIEGPAKMHPGMRQNRVLSPVAGAPKGFRNEFVTQLRRAWRRKYIDDSEFAAGECYSAFFQMMGRTGRDSLELVVRGGSSNTPFTDSQVTAIRAVQSIEANMDDPWRKIVRELCGYDRTPSEAVRAAGFKNAREVREKMRIALNKLAVAISRAHIPFGALNR